jgi:hypothetical protein
MILAVVGSRSIVDYEWVKKKILETYPLDEITEIVSGGARGVDSLAEKFAREYKKKLKVFPALWDVFGKSAGFQRNYQIVDYADEVIAFWDGFSNGTKHTIDTASQKRKACVVINESDYEKEKNLEIFLKG